MSVDQAEKLTNRYLTRKRVMKTAGEVRFIKDRGGDKSEWAWGTPGPNNREITQDYKFKLTNLKPLAKTLRAALSALGHAESAYSIFTKIKSSMVSPDGSLGGKGYIMKISDIRRQLMNAVEVLSAITDTLYDEIRAPHWNPETDEHGPREREEVKDIMNDAEDIKQDPEGWAEKEEAGEGEEVEEGEISEDQDEDGPGFGKMASLKTTQLWFGGSAQVDRAYRVLQRIIDPGIIGQVLHHPAGSIIFRAGENEPDMLKVYRVLIQNGISWSGPGREQ